MPSIPKRRTCRSTTLLKDVVRNGGTAALCGEITDEIWSKFLSFRRPTIDTLSVGTVPRRCTFPALMTAGSFSDNLGRSGQFPRTYMRKRRKPRTLNTPQSRFVLQLHWAPPLEVQTRRLSSMKSSRIAPKLTFSHHNGVIKADRSHPPFLLLALARDGQRF